MFLELIFIVLQEIAETFIDVEEAFTKFQTNVIVDNKRLFSKSNINTRMHRIFVQDFLNSDIHSFFLFFLWCEYWRKTNFGTCLLALAIRLQLQCRIVTKFIYLLLYISQSLICTSYKLIVTKAYATFKSKNGFFNITYLPR